MSFSHILSVVVGDIPNHRIRLKHLSVLRKSQNTSRVEKFGLLWFTHFILIIFPFFTRILGRHEMKERVLRRVFNLQLSLLSELHAWLYNSLESFTLRFPLLFLLLDKLFLNFLQVLNVIRVRLVLSLNSSFAKINVWLDSYDVFFFAVILPMAFIRRGVKIFSIELKRYLFIWKDRWSVCRVYLRLLCSSWLLLNSLFHLICKVVLNLFLFLI